MSARLALVASALLVGCAQLVGIGDFPGAPDAGGDAPDLGDAPGPDGSACTGAMVLTTSSDSSSVTSAGGFVFVETADGVVRCPTSGGCNDPPNLLNVAVDETFQAAAVGSSIVYSVLATSGGSIRATALDGSGSSTLVSVASGTPQNVAVSGSRTFWLDVDAGAVHCVGCVGSDALWMQGLVGTSDVFADSGQVYAVALDSGGNDAVYACGLTTPCGSSTPAWIDGLDLATYSTQFAADGARVYVARPDHNDIVGVDAISQVTTVVPNVHALTIAVDAKTGELFYMTDTGTLGRAKTDGSRPPTTIATCAFDPPITALAVDATSVYALVPPGAASTVYRFAR